MVVAAGQALLERGDGGEAVLLHDAAQLRRQRDVSLRGELEELVVLELLHEGRHVVLYASLAPLSRTQQLVLALVRRREGVRLLLHRRVEVAEVVPLVRLQELVRLRVQHELLLLSAARQLHAVVPDRHELVDHPQVQPLHQQRRHRVALPVHDHQLALPAVIEQRAALVFALDQVQHLAPQAPGRHRAALVADVGTLLERQAGGQDALRGNGGEKANVGRLAEHLVLRDLPLRGRAAQLQTVQQVQRVVVRVDRNEVPVELVDLLHAVVLVRARKLLDIVLAADVREV